MGETKVVDKFLRSEYYNVARKGGFASINKLFAATKKKFPAVKHEDIRKWLQSQETYGVHFPFCHKVQRSRIIVKGIGSSR